MKDPPSFSRLVDLRPVEPSRGPSLVKVNTNSRQCVSRSYPYFPLSLAQSIFVYVSLSLSLYLSRSQVNSTFFFHLEASTVLVPLSITSFSSPRHDRPLLSSPLLSSSPPLLLFASSPSDRTKNYSFFPDSVCIEFIRHVRLLSSSTFLPPSLDIVSVAVKLTRDQ